MSQIPINPDDPRLTAYALGELDPTEQHDVERLLADSPQAQSAIKEIRDLAAVLTAELRQEPSPALTAAQRAAILDGGVAPAVTSERNGVPHAQQVATHRKSAAATRAQHTARVKRFASLAAVAALLAVVVLLASPHSANHTDLIADNSTFGGRVDWLSADGTVTEFDAIQLRSELSARGEPRFHDALSQSADSPAPVRDSERSGVDRSPYWFAKDNAEMGRAVGAGQTGGGGTEESWNHAAKKLPRPRANQGLPANQPAGTMQAGDTRGFGNVANGSMRGAMGIDGKNSAPPVAGFKPAGGAAGFGAGGGALPGIQTTPASAATRPMGSAEKAPQARAAEPVGDRSRLSAPAVSEMREGEVNQHFKGIARSKSQAALRTTAGRNEAKQNGNGNVDHFGVERKPRSGDLAEGLIRLDEANKELAASAKNLNGRQWKDLADLETSYSRPAGVELHKREVHEGLTDLSIVLGAESYSPIVENPFLSAYETPLSTFGVDVDTASYSNVRRFLTNHQLPPPDAVRIEELVNYFSYDYPQPAAEQPFSVIVDAANCPWNPVNKLVRIGVKGKDIPRDQRPPGNFVFLVDVSGSMQAENKLPLVKMGLNLLTQQMTETDQVAIVTYSDTAVQRLAATNGARKQEVLQVIDSLHAAGSTNGADGIRLAYRAAIDHFIPGGANRVILCTDGDFNVGVTGDDELVQLIQERARTKVFFSVFGFGMGNLKDGKLEKLADKGNGHYAYIDGQNEARKVFVDELVGTLVTIAKDVKLQVEFNPNQVSSYRLLGYENRVMPAADFNNDTKDAGDVGAGHAVTSLYEVVPAGAAPKPEVGDSLRYRKAVVPQDGALSLELLTVKLRYKLPEADMSSLVEYPIANPINLATVADGREAPAFFSVQLQRLEAAPAAASLQKLFADSQQTAPVIETDTKNGRLLFRGSAEQITQSQQMLARLGEARGSAPRDLNWAAAVAAFGLILRDSQFRGQANLDMVLELATAAKGEDPTGRRQEFIELVKIARDLSSHRTESGFLETLSRMPRENLESLATVDGKYKNLLRIVEARGDSATYGAAHDFGRWEGTSYASQTDLPRGYWVYVYPNWYIWGDAAK